MNLVASLFFLAFLGGNSYAMDNDVKSKADAAYTEKINQLTQLLNYEPRSAPSKKQINKCPEEAAAKEAADKKAEGWAGTMADQDARIKAKKTDIARISAELEATQRSRIENNKLIAAKQAEIAAKELELAAAMAAETPLSDMPGGPLSDMPDSAASISQTSDAPETGEPVDAPLSDTITEEAPLSDTIPEEAPLSDTITAEAPSSESVEAAAPSSEAAPGAEVNEEGAVEAAAPSSEAAPGAEVNEAGADEAEGNQQVDDGFDEANSIEKVETDEEAAIEATPEDTAGEPQALADDVDLGDSDENETVETDDKNSGVRPVVNCLLLAPLLLLL